MLTNNNLNFEMNIKVNSPSERMNIDPENKEEYLMSTPKTKSRMNHDSKSPFILKKSKRRDCTPQYSPPGSSERKLCSSSSINKNLFYNKCMTEKVSKTTCKSSLLERFNQEYNFSGKLNFNNVQQINLWASDRPLRPDQEIESLTYSKKFLTLIEESLNEVTENYYGVLGSQTTPDPIFKTAFSEDKSKKRLSVMTFANEENPEKIEIDIDPNFDFSFKIKEIVDKIMTNLRNSIEFSILDNKTQILVIQQDHTIKEVNSNQFTECLLNFDYDVLASVFANESNILFVPGKVAIRNEGIKNVRFLFEIPTLSAVRLSVIEIQMFN